MNTLATNSSQMIASETIATSAVTAVATPTSSVASLPVLPPGEEIYDIAMPAVMPYPWLNFIIYYSLWALGLWIAYKLFIWIITPAPMKRKELPPIDPLKEALRALDRLRKSPLWEKGQVKDVCERLVYILKYFLKAKFELGIGVASTSDELIASMKTAEVNNRLIKISQELFDLCDSVRYAKGQLGATTFDDLLSSVETLLKSEEWQ